MGTTAGRYFRCMRRSESSPRRHGLMLAATFAMVLTAFGCQDSGTPPPASDIEQPGTAIARDISNSELKALLEDRPDLLLIDVRTDREWEDGHIPGAALLDFLEDDFESRAIALPKDRPIALYCAAGGRSEEAMKKMEKAGFRELYNLRGGFYGWEDGGETVSNEAPANLPAKED